MSDSFPPVTPQIPYAKQDPVELLAELQRDGAKITVADMGKRGKHIVISYDGTDSDLAINPDLLTALLNSGFVIRQRLHNESGDLAAAVSFRVGHC